MYLLPRRACRQERVRGAPTTTTLCGENVILQLVALALGRCSRKMYESVYKGKLAQPRKTQHTTSRPMADDTGYEHWL